MRDDSKELGFTSKAHNGLLHENSYKQDSTGKTFSQQEFMDFLHKKYPKVKYPRTKQKAAGTTPAALFYVDFRLQSLGKAFFSSMQSPTSCRMANISFWLRDFMMTSRSASVRREMGPAKDRVSSAS
ncbi:hypothetical protein SAMN05216583_12134 [Selenomonas sp. KH1T6]|nr:hypothetical protein SAMN05216583_12134 [Selenomonas ruminantium]